MKTNHLEVKTWHRWLSALAMVLVLTACGKGAGGTKDPAPGDSSAAPAPVNETVVNGRV